MHKFSQFYGRILPLLALLALVAVVAAGCGPRTAGPQGGVAYAQADEEVAVAESAVSTDTAGQSNMLARLTADIQGNSSAHDDQVAAAPAAEAEGGMMGGHGMADDGTAMVPAATNGHSMGEASVADVSFTLRTDIADGRLVFIGVGGTIDGVINPTLQVKRGNAVQVTLINGDGALHDVVFPDFGAATEQVTGNGSSSTTVFRAATEGEYVYYCSVAGHRAAGMEGKLIVGEAAGQQDEPVAPSIVREPTDLTAPLGEREPQTVRVELETIELEGQLADQTTYTFWTFNGKVPGPFVRVRVGDTVEVSLKNAADSLMIHSVDFHAVTGPGGGAAVTQAPPGEEKTFTFKALNPGLYVYHCATPMHAEHISNGMYGLILVEPEGGLAPVDHEFYVMQGEIYTQGRYGQHGHQQFNVEKLLNERPEYLTFNGAVGALTAQYPLRANVGETVRIFFGVGGPNLVSSFHVIGEIFDRVYDQASLTSAPLTDVQTTLVPPGGASMVEFTLDVPGRYILVDHALSRLERGLVGFLQVEGEPNPEVFREGGQ